jgi:ribonuclease HI
MGRHPIPDSSNTARTLDHVLRWVAYEIRSGCWLALHFTPRETCALHTGLHFPASNNVAEYEALVNGLRIVVELGVWRLDARGDSQLVIDQVMKNSHCRDRKMEAYCDEVRRLEDKSHGLELNHVARRYNETADELAKIASGQTTVPPNVFSRDIYQPSIKIDDTPEPEETSAQPEVPSAAEGEALRVEGEQNRVAPNQNWQTPYLEYLL